MGHLRTTEIRQRRGAPARATASRWFVRDTKTAIATEALLRWFVSVRCSPPSNGRLRTGWTESHLGPAVAVARSAEHPDVLVRHERVREDRNLDLVVRARNGDLDAFETLVHAHTPAAYRLASSIVGEGLARDVVQDAFLAAWRELARLRDPDRFGPWLYRIVVNRCRSIQRAGRGVREISMNAFHESTIRAEVDDLGPAEARAVIASSFRRLSLEQRSLLSLHYAAGLSIREVADVLQIPVGTAKSRLAAALAILRSSTREGGR